MVKNDRDHYKVPQTVDVQMAKFLTLNTTTFGTTNEKDFHYVGAILDFMLNKVPVNKAIISI